MEIKEPKFKVGDKVIDILNNEQLIVSEIIYYRFYDDNYLYVLNFNDGERFGYEDELHLTPYVEKPKSVWYLKNGDDYVVAHGDGKMHKDNWDGMPFEKRYRELGNAFLTKEEAEFELERRKIEAKMLQLGGRRKFEIGKSNWYLEYRPASGAIEAMWSSYEMRQGAIYFDSEEKSKEVVDEIGKDRIKKYIFGIEE